MVTTETDIKRWLVAENGKGHTHMIVVCDTFDYEDYPVYITATTDEAVKARIDYYTKAPMSRVMEVYNYSLDFDYQITYVDKRGRKRAWFTQV